MSTVTSGLCNAASGAVAVSAPKERPLQRLGAVRLREGVSRRTVARRLKTSINDVKRQEEETTDLPLSALYKWQQALEVPVTELLVDASEPLSSPVRTR